MAGSTSSTSSSDIDNEESGNVTSKNINLSTSFTISFEDESNSTSARHKKLNSSNMCVKRHVRTFSLPFINNWQVTKKYSGEDDTVKSEVCKEENNNKNTVSRSLHDQIVKDLEIIKFTHMDNVINGGSENSVLKDNIDKDDESVEKSNSDESEGGTYTLDENNEQVQLARKSIDQVFGISSVASHDENLSNNEKLQIKSHLVNEWMEQSLVTPNLVGEALPVPAYDYCSRNKSYSKIPSPLVKRHEMHSEEISSNSIDKTSFQLRKKKFVNGLETKPYEQPANSPTNGKVDPEYYLKETESIVTALQNKLRSNIKSKPAIVAKKETERPEKEAIVNKYPNTRFNKAFSLRRERAKNFNLATNNTAIPVRTRTAFVSGTENFSHGNFLTEKKTMSKNLNKNKTNFSSSTVTTTLRVSGETSRREDIKKKNNQSLKQNECRARCNSSLSAQEIEFQNWKRRKNYDPLKAAAEDRKKKSLMHSVAISCPSSDVIVQNNIKSNQPGENCSKDDQLMIRSASFHGLQCKNGLDVAFHDENIISRSLSNQLSSSEWTSNEQLIVPSVQNDDNGWTVSESLSEIDLTALINIRELSQEIKTTVFSIREALWSNYAECSKNVNSAINNSPLELDVCHTSKNSTARFSESDKMPFNVRSDKGNYLNSRSGNNNTLNDLPVDRQLTITWDNLQQIRTAVHDLQLVAKNK